MDEWMGFSKFWQGCSFLYIRKLDTAEKPDILKNLIFFWGLVKYVDLEIQPPYGGLLSSSCGGVHQKGPSGPNVILADKRTDDNRFKGV